MFTFKTTALRRYFKKPLKGTDNWKEAISGPSWDKSTWWDFLNKISSKRNELSTNCLSHNFYSLSFLERQSRADLADKVANLGNEFGLPPFLSSFTARFSVFFSEYTFGSFSFLISLAVHANKYFFWKEMRVDGLMMMSLLSCISTPKN